MPMQADPIDEWQRLTAHYRELSDDELRELAADFNDLTESAQQALRAEMTSRGLGPEKARAAPESPRLVSNAPEVWRNDSALSVFDSILGPTALAFGSRQPELVPDAPNSSDDDAGPHEYTWKTVLCECDTNEQARELSAALLQARIESWVQQAREFGRRYPCVLVAADQLDQARAIAARPIPPEIIAESEAAIPEFDAPSCPKCGASDPVLEGVDPVNSWKCEQCGKEWTDPATPEVPQAG